MNLRVTIAGIHQTYLESVFRLTSYVKDISNAIQDLRTRHDKLSKKLVAAKEGMPFDDPEAKKPGAQLIQLELKDEELEVMIEAVQLKQGYVEKYPDFAFEMAFVYLVATFDAFLTDIFEAVIISKPAILKSKKQISYDKLLDFASTSELIDHLAKRELNELSYKSINEQAEYYKDKFGVSLVVSGTPIEDLIEIRSARNLLVHNNGIINHIYLDQVKASPYNLGEHVRIDAAYFQAANKKLRKVVQYLATELTTKFAE